MADWRRSLHGAALWRLEQLRSEDCDAALQAVRSASDPAAVMDQLEPQALEYVELALLTTTATAIHAARFRGASAETIEQMATALPEPLRERLQAMVRESWARWRPIHNR